VRAAFACSRLAARRMVQQDGRFVPVPHFWHALCIEVHLKRRESHA
jgi:hypothetical protein